MKNKYRIKTELITAYMQTNKLSKTAFCKTCKIGLITLNKVLDNKHDVGLLALFRIARIIQIPIHELFESAPGQ